MSGGDSMRKRIKITQACTTFKCTQCGTLKVKPGLFMTRALEKLWCSECDEPIDFRAMDQDIIYEEVME